MQKNKSWVPLIALVGLAVVGYAFTIGRFVGERKFADKLKDQFAKGPFKAHDVQECIEADEKHAAILNRDGYYCSVYVRNGHVRPPSCKETLISGTFISKP